MQECFEGKEGISRDTKISYHNISVDFTDEYIKITYYGSDYNITFYLKEHDIRLHLGLSEEAFASRLGGRARDLLANVRT